MQAMTKQITIRVEDEKQEEISLLAEKLDRSVNWVVKTCIDYGLLMMATHPDTDPVSGKIGKPKVVKPEGSPLKDEVRTIDTSVPESPGKYQGPKAQLPSGANRAVLERRVVEPRFK